MSSDAFRYRVAAVEGRDVVLEIRPTTAGGLCDLAWSRSFVLMLLREQQGPVEYEQTMSIPWLTEHLDEFVERVVPEALVGFTSESTLRDVCRDYCIPAEHFQPRLRVRATMASEALAAHFGVGASDGTTAFDVWWQDPRHVAQLPRAEDAPEFDPQPEFERRVCMAIAARSQRWSLEHDRVVYEGADARLVVRPTSLCKIGRANVEVELALEVPAFERLPVTPKARGSRVDLVQGQLHDACATHRFWHRRFAHEPEVARVEYFGDDAPQESFEAFVERLAGAIEPPELDALLHRDGLRGLVELGITRYPTKKGQTAPVPLGSWAAPSLPPTFHWTWKLGKHQSWRTEPLWSRVALHAAFGSEDEARSALAQARALSGKPPAIWKALFASLD